MTSLVALLLGLPPFVPPQRHGGEFGPNEHPGAFLYEEGTISEIAFRLDDDALDALGRDEPDVHATLAYRGVEWDVGFKLKGSSTYQGMGDKPSMKVDLEQWVEDQKMLGVRRLTLNNMIFDPSMLREHVAYELFARMGVPAPRHGYAWVTVNGEDYGLYGVVETLDEQWLRRWFPGDSEGNLYDSNFTAADLTGFGVGSFVIEEGDRLGDASDLRALVSELDRGDILDVLERRFDMESVLSMWAVELATPNWDGYARNTNNYLLYHATVSDRWYFVPWGQDTTFRGGGTLYAGVRGRMVAACVADGDCRRALEDRVREVLDVWESSDLRGYAEATWATIQASCEADPRRSERCDPGDIFDALTDRPESLRRELGG